MYLMYETKPELKFKNVQIVKLTFLFPNNNLLISKHKDLIESLKKS